jgi:hypothetical protein
MNVAAQQIAHRLPNRGSLFERDWKSITKWCVWAFVLIAAIYRLLTFVPQPLDSSYTLRPHLYYWFAIYLNWFSSPGIAQARWDRGCSLLVLVPAVLALLNYLSVSNPHSRPRSRAWQLLFSRTLFFSSIALVLFACRFPVLLAGQINPDEGQFLAGAQKLFVDPIFFRSVDCATSGPFNIFPLMLPALVGLSPDFASSRVMGLLIILASVYILYRAFCLLVDEHQARIAILPAAAIFAVLRIGDFVHFSSEHVSFLLVSLAVFLCTKVVVQPARYAAALFGLGMLTAMAFFAKMQAVPIVSAVAMAAMACAYWTAGAVKWWRPAAMFLAGTAPLPVINAIVCLSVGVWNDFLMSYIVTNYRYSQTPALDSGHYIEFALGVQEIRLLIVTLLAIFAAYGYHQTQREQAGSMSLYLRLCAVGGITALAADCVLRSSAGSLEYGYAARVCIFVFAASVVLMASKKSGRMTPMGWFGLTTAAVLAASLFASYAPHRAFPHYLLLLVIPLCMAISWPMLAWFKAANVPIDLPVEDKAVPPHIAPGLPFVLLFVTLTVTGQSFLHGMPSAVGFSTIQAGIRSPDSDFVRSITQASDQIVVWGWNTNLYLGSGRVAGTRELNMVNLFFPNDAVSSFYRGRFLRDMRRTRPAWFIDASGPTSFMGTRGEFADRQNGGFETVPELHSYFESNYVQVAEAYGQRYYVRRDLRGGKVVVDRSNQCSAGAIRCVEGPAGPVELPPIQMPDHAILDVVFIPVDEKETYATVFSNDAGPQEQKGFQFHSVGMNQFQLAVGVGGQWARSRVLVLPHLLPVALSFEFNGKTIAILYNGVECEKMQLPARMADTGAPITIGSWIGRQRLLASKILLFQIRDMGRGVAVARQGATQ